jgi:hypothetical protein
VPIESVKILGGPFVFETSFPKEAHIIIPNSAIRAALRMPPVRNDWARRFGAAVFPNVSAHGLRTTFTSK